MGILCFTKYFPTAEQFGTGASLQIDFADKPEARFVLIRFDSDYTNYLAVTEVQVSPPPRRPYDWVKAPDDKGGLVMAIAIMPVRR
jgi:hypothetical protein